MNNFVSFEYLLGVTIFPIFMITITFFIAPGGVLALIAQYPLWSFVIFILMILFVLEYLTLGLGVKIGD